jgi:hypothetical protein
MNKMTHNKRKSLSPPPPRILPAKFILTSLFILTLAFALASCNDSASGNDSINGTWVNDADPSDVEIFNNGSFEFKDAGEPFIKGTYTTSGGKLTVTFTHVWVDDAWVVVTPEMASSLGVSLTHTVDYSVKGNKLTIEGDTFTKQ